jgi:hypothetical protein
VFEPENEQEIEGINVNKVFVGQVCNLPKPVFSGIRQATSLTCLRLSQEI